MGYWVFKFNASDIIKLDVRDNGDGNTTPLDVEMKENKVLSRRRRVTLTLPPLYLVLSGSSTSTSPTSKAPLFQ